MTQKVLVALSAVVIAVSMAGYWWQSKSIPLRTGEVRNVAQGDLSGTVEERDVSTVFLGSDQGVDGVQGRLQQIDQPPVTTKFVAQTGVELPQAGLPPATGANESLPADGLPGGAAVQIPSGNGLNRGVGSVSKDGVLRYRAILSFVNDIKVVAQADGIVLDILVDEGAVVSKDTVMIQIDNRLANAEKEIAIRELESAKLKAEDESQIKFSEASYDVASSVFKRSQELYQTAAESLDDLEKKRLELIKAGFQIDVSKREQKINEAAVGVNEAKLNASMVQLELRTIKAPFSGVVASVQKERYDWVKAGEEILRMVSLDKFRVKGTVRLTESPNNLEGARAKVIVPVGSGRVEEIEGVVGFVSPESQGTGARADGTDDYAVWVEIPNKQVAGKYLFRGGMDAEVEIYPKR